MNGAIYGQGGLQKQGAGTLVLNYANTYPGSTNVSGGTLFVGGSISSSAVTVSNGGTLSGAGTTGSVTVASGGTLAPGNGVTGSLSLNNQPLTLSGKTTVSVNAATGAVTQVRGISSARYGGTLTVTNQSGNFAAGNSFTLFSASSYSGAFSSITLPALPDSLQWDTSKLATNGSISVLQTPWGSWQTQYFSGTQLADPSVSGPTAAPNGDGVPNLIKYAFGMSPFAGASLPISTDVEMAGGNTYLRLTITKNPSAGDISYVVEAAGDVSAGNWSAVGTVVETNTSSVLVVRDSVPLRSAGTRFLRLRVNRP
jgi:autotransporter-associated beta strand protein